MAGDGRSGLGSAWAQAQPYVDATWEFIGATGLCTFGGWWLDGKFHTTPWLLVAGAVFGFTTGMTIMFRRFLSLGAKEKAQQGKPEGKA